MLITLVPTHVSCSSIHDRKVAVLALCSVMTCQVQPPCIVNLAGQKALVKAYQGEGGVLERGETDDGGESGEVEGESQKVLQIMSAWYIQRWWEGCGCGDTCIRQSVRSAFMYQIAECRPSELKGTKHPSAE